MADPAEEMDIFDVEDADAKAPAIAEGVADAEAGRVYPHSIVRQWLERLALNPKLPFNPDDYH